MGIAPGSTNTGRPSTAIATSPALSTCLLRGARVTMSLAVPALSCEVARTTACGAP